MACQPDLTVDHTNEQIVLVLRAADGERVLPLTAAEARTLAGDLLRAVHDLHNHRRLIAAIEDATPCQGERLPTSP